MTLRHTMCKDSQQTLTFWYAWLYYSSFRINHAGGFMGGLSLQGKSAAIISQHEPRGHLQPRAVMTCQSNSRAAIYALIFPHLFQMKTDSLAPETDRNPEKVSTLSFGRWTHDQSEAERKKALERGKKGTKRGGLCFFILSESDPKVAIKSLKPTLHTHFHPAQLLFLFFSSWLMDTNKSLSIWRLELVICSPPSPWNRFCGTIRYRGFNGNGSRGIMRRSENRASNSARHKGRRRKSFQNGFKMFGLCSGH